MNKFLGKSKYSISAVLFVFVTNIFIHLVYCLLRFIYLLILMGSIYYYLGFLTLPSPCAVHTPSTDPAMPPSMMLLVAGIRTRDQRDSKRRELFWRYRTLRTKQISLLNYQLF